MSYNGRDVMEGVAYDCGWTTVRDILPSAHEDGIQIDLHTKGDDHVVIAWTANNTATYVGLSGVRVEGSLALIEARRFIEERAS